MLKPTTNQFSYQPAADQQICPSTDGQDPHSWCIFQAYNPRTVLIEQIFLVIVIFVTIFILVQSNRLRKYRAGRYKTYFGGAYGLMYWVGFLWCLTFVGRAIVNILAYYYYMEYNQQQQNDPDLYSPLVTYSNIFLVLDFCGAFIINLLCILIPYQFFKILLVKISQSQLITFQTLDKFKSWFRWLNRIRYYWVFIRNIALLLAILQPLLFYLYKNIRCDLIIYNKQFIVLESFVILIFYFFIRIKISFLRKKQLLKMQSKDILGVGAKFTIFLIVLIVRIIINSIQIIQKNIGWKDPNRYIPNGVCFNTNQNWLQVLSLIAHHSFMHLAAIFLILYIYRIKKPYEKANDFDSLSDNSLIGTDTSYYSIRQKFYHANINQSVQASIKKESSFIQFT